MKKSEVEKARDAADMQASEDMGSPESTVGDGKQVRFAASAKSGSRLGASKKTATQSKLSRPILSDEHEATNKFSSATGGTFTATKRLETEQAYFLSNNKGIAIVFNPQQGELPAHSEVTIGVTIYNNVCGKFDDKFVSEIKGLPPVEFPVNI